MMAESTVRPAAVAGRFYPANRQALSDMIGGFLAEVESDQGISRAVIVPHAGLIYSGQCAAAVFQRVILPRVVVIMAPNHTGLVDAPGGASLWARGSFETPLGAVLIAESFARQLEDRCRLVAHDPEAHRAEHAVEVELPFIATLAPGAKIVPIVLAWDDWNRCRELATDLAELIEEWPDEVLLVASSDMTHFESASRAAEKDRKALAAIERLDAEALLEVCRRERITMCGRAPAAVALETARQLGATRAEVVDYRHSGWVTGDDSSVVGYAGVVVT
ncbi:MAG: AmmeMemoRadiSam system protein B [Gemmatimonadota bacterium]|nr:MAG: AmmeMemoRadiSam system protein B [Gemmatimonadota bacterium]